MADREQKHCKCGASIRFIKTGKKKDGTGDQWHPVDEKAERMWIYVGGKWTLVDVYRSHYQTCPNAKEFREKKNQQKPSEEKDEFDMPW